MELTNYPGTQDRFTGDILLREWILTQFQTIYRSLGFHLVETPCLEPVELLAKEGGVGEQPTFTFGDTHGDKVCLKPDQTISLRRVIEQHEISLPFPRHQVGFAFRQDKPEKGRCREFTQCDADVIGAAVGVSDAETILWLVKGFGAIGLPDTMIYINARDILRALYAGLGTEYYDELTFVRAADKVPADGSMLPVERYLRTGHGKAEGGVAVFDEALESAVSKIVDVLDEARTYRSKPIQEALSSFVVSHPDASGSIAALQKVVRYAEVLGVPLDSIRFDPCLARGMDYYTGPVFEAQNPRWPYGSLAGGGRYDQMIKVRGEAQPAVGASFGLERIEQALGDLGLVPEQCSQALADVLIATREEWMPGPLVIAKQIRDLGFRAVLYPEPSHGLKKQTKFAASNRVPLVVFYGEDEQAANSVTLRTVTEDKVITSVDAAKAAKNVTIPLSDMASEIQKLLERSET